MFWKSKDKPTDSQDPLAALIALISTTALTGEQAVAAASRAREEAQIFLNDLKEGAALYGGQEPDCSVDELLGIGISAALPNQSFSADRVDGIHEWLQGAIEGLPDFPEEMWDEDSDTYFCWVDEQLQAQHPNGLCLLKFGYSLNDEMMAILAPRANRQQIIADAGKLGIAVTAAT